MNKIKKFFTCGRKKSRSNNKDFILSEATKKLKKQKYEFVDILGQGSFGIVMKVKSTVSNTEIAAKVVLKEETSAEENVWWPVFKHDNVLPLLNRIKHKLFNIYLMPCHSESLLRYVSEKYFRSNAQKLLLVKCWLKDILNGLHYLHDMNICHLDLKADNVLITAENRAVICDFTFVNVADVKTSKYGLPPCWKSPEACVLGREPEIYGIPYDIWSFGVLSFTLLTSIYLPYKKDDPVRKQLALQQTGENYWIKFVYPLLFDGLQFCNFLSRMHDTISGVPIKGSTVTQALNLIRGTLTFHPEDRPKTSQLLQHAFVADYSKKGKYLTVDPIWILRIDDKGKAKSKIDDREQKSLPSVKEPAKKILQVPDAILLNGMQETPSHKRAPAVKNLTRFGGGDSMTKSLVSRQLKNEFGTAQTKVKGSKGQLKCTPFLKRSQVVLNLSLL